MYCISPIARLISAESMSSAKPLMAVELLPMGGGWGEGCASATTPGSGVATPFALLFAAAVVLVDVRGLVVRRAVFSLVVVITSFLSLLGTHPNSTYAPEMCAHGRFMSGYTR